MSNIKKRALKVYEKAGSSAALRASIQAIPVIGGSLDTLIFDYAQKIKEKRIKRFIEKISKEIEKIDESKIDKKFLISNEFLGIVEQIFINISREWREEKIEVLKKVLLNSITLDYSQDERKEFFIKTILELNPVQIKILQFCYEKHGKIGYDEMRNSNDLNLPMTYGEIEQKLDWPQGNYSNKGLIDDLMAKGLVFDWTIGRYDYSPFRFALTEFGREIIKFITIK